MNTILLAVIAAAVLWGFVLRDPVLAAWRGYRQRRRVLSAVVAPSPVAVPVPPSTSVQLLLCNAHGQIEHEIALHQDELPETYTYAGKTYARDARHHGKGHQHDHDVVWEYRR